MCSIICCLGKRSSKHKNKDKEVSANANTGDVIDSGNAKPSKAPQKALLPDLRPEEADKKCIVIDLDETLVHSSFKVIILTIFSGPKQKRSASDSLIFGSNMGVIGEICPFRQKIIFQISSV